MIDNSYEGDFFAATNFDDVLSNSARSARKNGFEGVDVSGGGLHDAYFNPDTTIIFDPRNIRSKFARFDPRLKHLANLSAGVGGLTLGSTLYGNKPSLRDYLQQ